MSWFVSSPGNGCCKWERMCQSLWKHQRLHCLHLHGRTEPSQVTPYTLYPNGKNHAKNIHLKALPGGVRIFQGSDIGRSSLMLGPPKDQLLLLSKLVRNLKNILQAHVLPVFLLWCLHWHLRRLLLWSPPMYCLPLPRHNARWKLCSLWVNFIWCLGKIFVNSSLK